MSHYQLGRTDRRLAGQLTLLLYRRVKRQLSSTSGSDPDFRYAGQDGGDFLVKLGLCKKRKQPLKYVFLVEESAVVETVEKNKNLASNDVLTLLEFFFRFFIAHGRIGCLSSTREAFTPRPEMEVLAQSLTNYGLLNRIGQKYAWDATAAKYMNAHGHWKAGISKYDQRMAYADERFEKLYTEMPQCLIELLAEIATSYGNSKVLDVLPRYYWDNEWLVEPVSAEKAKEAGRFGQLGLVTTGKLVEKLKADHGF